MPVISLFKSYINLFDSKEKKGTETSFVTDESDQRKIKFSCSLLLTSQKQIPGFVCGSRYLICIGENSKNLGGKVNE